MLRKSSWITRAIHSFMVMEDDFQGLRRKVRKLFHHVGTILRVLLDKRAFFLGKPLRIFEQLRRHFLETDIMEEGGNSQNFQLIGWRRETLWSSISTVAWRDRPKVTSCPSRTSTIRVRCPW